MVNKSEDLVLRDKLQKCTTIKQMFEVLQNDYDLDIKPGIGSKIIIVDAVVKAYKFINPKKK